MSIVVALYSSVLREIPLIVIKCYFPRTLNMYGTIKRFSAVTEISLSSAIEGSSKSDTYIIRSSINFPIYSFAKGTMEIGYNK